MNPKLLAPIVIAGITAVGAFSIVATAPSVEHVEPTRAIPTVRVIDAIPQTLRYGVKTQGTVKPRTEADLVPEVSGRVVWIAPSLARGGFFEAGEALVRLESRDYELARDRQAAALQRVKSEGEFAAAELARQEGLSRAGVASQSQIADARRAGSVAEANMLDARAGLEQAQRDLDRTEIRAPFQGRVRDERVDVGQFVSRGAVIASLYATDYAEIRLPIADDQLAFLDLLTPSPDDATFAVGGPVVRLSATFAGLDSQWIGRVVRTEGEIDPRSRMIHVVARVENPYDPQGEDAVVPLAVGLFVQAEIEGPEVHDVVVVPRYAMRNDSQILIVDAESRLYRRQVDVLRIDRDQVLVKGPLAEGERICVSPLQVVVEGMRVRPVEDELEVDAASKAGRS
jgi:RND family efflux transporter MFP subunit